MAFGGSFVPKTNLILSLICRDYFSERSANDPTFQFAPVMIGQDNPQCRIPEVQAIVSRFTMYCSIISGILSAIMSPKIGALTDRYGRNRFIALGTGGMFAAEILTIVVATYPEAFSVYWIVAGYALDGLCGSFIVVMAAVNSYASDVTPPPKRAIRFAYFHAMLFTGIALGPITAGYLVKWSGSLLTVFYCALIAHFIFAFSVLFIIPESLTKERQLAARKRADFIGEAEAALRAQSRQRTLEERLGGSMGSNWEIHLHSLKGAWESIYTFGGLFSPLSILYPTGEGSSPALRRNLLFLAAVDTTMFGVAMGSMTIVVIYLNFQFGWGTFESSVFVSEVNVSRVCFLIVILPLVTRLARKGRGSMPQRNSGSDSFDLWVIRAAIAADVLGYVGYSVVRSGRLFTVAGILAAAGGVGSPTLQAALTKHVPQERTGQLLGAIGLLHALARVVSPTIFNLIYSVTVGKFTQTVFVCLAACFGVAFFLSFFIKPHGTFGSLSSNGCNPLIAPPSIF